jgi:threonine dehydratase
MRLPVTLHDVEAAEERIGKWIVPTPLVEAPALAEKSGARVFLKLETRQRTGSFKDRGAANRLLSLAQGQAEPVRGVITMSAGNHAQSVAYQCKRLGIPATIIMPEMTPFTKVRRTKQHGARVLLCGDTLAEAARRAQQTAQEENLVLVHPYDDACVIAGQGTVALEMLREVPDLDILLVPVGGGGLVAGTLAAVKEMKPSVRVIGVQTEAYPSLYALLRGLEPMPGGQTIAEGIAVKSIGEMPLAIARALLDDVMLVNEQEIESAIHTLLEEEKLLAEGAGAAGVAALLASSAQFAGKRVGVMLSGGNIDSGLLANVIMRVRLREGRVVRLRIEINDKPGVLADIARIIGDTGANIIDVVHHRFFSDVPSKQAELDVTFETRSPADVEMILRKLTDAEYPVKVLESTARAGK